jgi:hypothetical protein
MPLPILFKAGIAQSAYLRARRLGCHSRQGQDFSLLYIVQTGSGAHPASYIMGTVGCFPGGKSDHSPPTSAEVKNSGAIPSLPHAPSWRAA